MPKVVIIGAGAAGLAATARLLEKGLKPDDLVLLEAQDRIGGRVHTIFQGNDDKSFGLEMGAQWVHGKEGNVIHSIASNANELNTDIQTSEGSGLSENVVFSFENGIVLTPEQRKEFFDFIQTSKEELSYWKGSYGGFLMKRLHEAIEQEHFKTLDNSTAWALFDWYQLMENQIDGSYDWMETCSSEFTLYRECPGDPLVTWKHGYSVFFNMLMNDEPTFKNIVPPSLKNIILLNKPVKVVNWDNDGDEKQVIVTVDDGSTYSADYVIVTCSLGVLKEKADRLFEPALPTYKLNAIQGIGFGTVDKIYLKFEKPWWPSSWGGVSFLRRSASRDLSKDWADNINGFFTVPNHPNLLIGWVTGMAARTEESLPSSEVLRTCSDRLKRYLGPDVDYTEPVEMIRSAWYSNIYTRGSYSYRSLHTTEQNVLAADIAEPVKDSSGKMRLLFAGEATHDYFFSTVHGAVETGWREADRIVKILNETS